MVLILLACEYDKEINKVILKFYDSDDKKIIPYVDKTEYRPYCLTDMEETAFYHYCFVSKGIKDLKLVPTEPIEKFNPITKQKQMFTKLIGKTPLDIADQYNMGGRNISEFLEQREDGKVTESQVWENNIYYRYNYIFDNQLVFGMAYELELKEISIRQPKKCDNCDSTYGIYEYYIKKVQSEGVSVKDQLILGVIRCEACKNIIYTNPLYNPQDYNLYFTVDREFEFETVIKKVPIPVLCEVKIDPKIKAEVLEAFKNESVEERKMLEQWLPYFFAEFPIDMQRVAMDIELFSEDDNFPSDVAIKAELPISDVQFVGIDGKKKCFLLKVWNEDGEANPNMDKTIEIEEFEKHEEKKMLRAIYKYIDEIPVLVTFNGNNFDLTYLYHRGLKLGFNKLEIPIIFKKTRSGMYGNEYECGLKHGIHFDLYNFFSSRSLKAYAFKSAYQRNTLREVTTALLPSGETKVDDTFFLKTQKAHCSHCNITFYSENGKDWKKIGKSDFEKELDWKNEPSEYFEDTESESESETKDEEIDEDIIHFIEKDKKTYCPFCDTEIIVNRNLKEISQYTRNELIYYCFTDTKITLELTRYNDCMVMKLLFIMMRLSKTGLDDFILHQISYWLKNLFYFEHRIRGYLIPQESQIRKITKACTESVGNKQFQGALVVKTIAGIHFNVKVLDFASLYPSIIKTRNLSYETVDCCVHEDCKKNIVPETTHWVCQKHQGIVAVVLGMIRDVRVKYFKEKEDAIKKQIKELSKDKKNDSIVALLKKEVIVYNVLQQALKVFINAGYGVFASMSFQFFQIGVAESTTAYGRFSITSVLEKAEERKITVVLGDTDSSFMKNPTKEDIAYFQKFADDTLKVSLDLDAEYRFIAISERKKNYIGFPEQSQGITPDSPQWKKPTIKGIKAKKTNTPPFIKEEIDKLITHLSVSITQESQIEPAKNEMKQRVIGLVKKVCDGKIPLEKMIIFQKLSKSIEDYGKPPILHFNRALVGLLHERIPNELPLLINLIKVRYKHEAGVDNTSEETEKQISSMIRTNLNLNFTDTTKSKELLAKLKTDKNELRKWIYSHFQTKGFPQASRCALMIASTGEEVRKGDFITYIKVKDKEKGAVPLGFIQNVNEVDIDTYLGEIESSFSQIYDCFGVDTESLIDQARTGKKTIPLTSFMKKKSTHPVQTESIETKIESEPNKFITPNEPFIPKMVIEYTDQSMNDLLNIVKENISRGIPFTIKFTNNTVKQREFASILESHKNVLNLWYVRVEDVVEKPKKKTGLDLFATKKK